MVPSDEVMASGAGLQGLAGGSGCKGLNISDGDFGYISCRSFHKESRGTIHHFCKLQD